MPPFLSASPERSLWPLCRVLAQDSGRLQNSLMTGAWHPRPTRSFPLRQSLNTILPILTRNVRCPGAPPNLLGFLAGSQVRLAHCFGLALPFLTPSSLVCLVITDLHFQFQLDQSPLQERLPCLSPTLGARRVAHSYFLLNPSHSEM